VITISAQLLGESLVLLTSPPLATDTVDTVSVVFQFDNEWAGFSKTAMFWGTDDEEYPVEVINDAAIIPKEVMAEVGRIQFGVYGTDGDKLLVSSKVLYKIQDGAFVRAG